MDMMKWNAAFRAAQLDFRYSIPMHRRLLVKFSIFFLGLLFCPYGHGFDGGYYRSSGPIYVRPASPSIFSSGRSTTYSYGTTRTTTNHYGTSYNTSNYYGPSYNTINNYGSGGTTLNSFGSGDITVNHNGTGRVNVNYGNRR